MYVAKAMKDRKVQRSLMQSFEPENYFTVREALTQAGRAEFIGNGCDCLIPAHPPKEAVETDGGRPTERFRATRTTTITTQSPIRRGARSGVSVVPGRSNRPSIDRDGSRRSGGRESNTRSPSGGSRA